MKNPPEYDKTDIVPFMDIPGLSTDAADKILANVFDDCELDPPSVPLEKLATYSKYRRERYTLQKRIIIGILIVFLLLPLQFIAPHFTVTQISEAGTGYPEYSIRVDPGIIPIKRVTAAVNGMALGVYESGSRSFSVSPTENGSLSVRVTLGNGQYNLASAEVRGIDVDKPEFLSSSREGDQLVIFVKESGSGLDAEGIAAYSDSGLRIPPLEIDVQAGRIVFAFPEESVNIQIPDRNGNILQMVISVHP